MHCAFGEDSELGFIVTRKDSLFTDLSIECRILLIDQSSLESSYEISKHPSNRRSIGAKDKNCAR